MIIYRVHEETRIVEKKRIRSIIYCLTNKFVSILQNEQIAPNLSLSVIIYRSGHRLDAAKQEGRSLHEEITLDSLSQL